MSETKTTEKETTKTTEKAPVEVTIVPNDGLTPEQREAQAETQTPENTKNREASYLGPVEGVNLNAPEEKK